MQKPNIFGIGVDIVEIGRIERLAKARGNFLKRVFSEEEIRYCRSKARKWQHFAVRFAAKEAVWKALGGRGKGIRLRDILVRRDAFGKPKVVFRRVSKLPEPLELELSLAHSDNYAVAAAIATCRRPKPSR